MISQDSRNTRTITDAERLAKTEVKSMVAKLLAREDVTIQRGDFKTASFDLKNRILKLPLWKDITNDELDLFIGHEVSHALNTPENGIDIFLDRFKGVPFSICNVVEDVRIERLVQKEYPGLIRSFRNGYDSLYEKDFFGLEDAKMEDRGFVDRLNIHAKLGSRVDVPFNDEEQALVDAAFATKTFDDVLNVIENIVEYVDENEEDEDEQEEEQLTSMPNSEDEDEDEDEAADFQSSDSNKTEDESDGFDNSSSDDTDNEDDQKETESSAAGKYGSKSQQSFEEKLEDTVVDSVAHSETSFGETQGTLHHLLEPAKERIQQAIHSYDELEMSRAAVPYNTPELYDADWIKFKRTNKKYVAALKREFDMKKSAYQYTRAKVSKTGQLDVNKLHSYKYSEDIFNSITTLADAKNHGMLYFLDMSGSMHYRIKAVYKQAINLAMFCKSVGIPFEMYGFTTGRRVADDYYEKFPSIDGMIDVSDLRIVELLNSDLKPKRFEKALKDMFVAAQRFDSYSSCSELEQLSGTPLSETIICAHTIAKEFIKKHKPQHLTTMWLTDGEGCQLAIDGGVYPWRNDRSVVKIGGKMVEFKDSLFNHRTQPALLENYAKVTGSKNIHFFLVDNKREIGHQYHISDKTQWKRFRKDNLITLDGNKGFDRVFVVGDRKVNSIEDSSTFSEETVNRELTDNELKRAFINHNKSKKGQRVFVNKFVEIIA